MRGDIYIPEKEHRRNLKGNSSVKQVWKTYTGERI